MQPVVTQPRPGHPGKFVFQLLPKLGENIDSRSWCYPPENRSLSYGGITSIGLIHLEPTRRSPGIGRNRQSYFRYHSRLLLPFRAVLQSFDITAGVITNKPELDTRLVMLELLRHRTPEMPCTPEDVIEVRTLFFSPCIALHLMYAGKCPIDDRLDLAAPNDTLGDSGYDVASVHPRVEQNSVLSHWRVSETRRI